MAFKNKQAPWNKDRTKVYSEKTLKLMSEAKKGNIPWNKVRFDGR